MCWSRENIDRRQLNCHHQLMPTGDENSTIGEKCCLREFISRSDRIDIDKVAFEASHKFSKYRPSAVPNSQLDLSAVLEEG